MLGAMDALSDLRRRLGFGRRGAVRAAVVVGLLCAASVALFEIPANAQSPHRSWRALPTGNGYAHAVFDGDSRRMSFFSEHPYADRAPTERSRDLAYDAYFGLRASGAGAWLTQRDLDDLEYVEQTHVVHATQRMGPLRGETYIFSPWGLEAPSVVLAIHVTNDSRVPLTDSAAYVLLNFHVGTGSPEPSAVGERIRWDAPTSSLRESGPSGLTLSYLPFPAPSVHGASPDNPYGIVLAGGDLVSTDDSGTRDDAAGGFQWTIDSLAPWQDRWFAVLITLAPAADGRAFLAGRDPRALIDAEVAAWNAWRVPPPPSLAPPELRAWRQSESVLRMAQSREPAPARGQLIAALPPGIWQVTWARDMSYAMAALARSGHVAEANLGVDFLQNAHVGYYRMYVGSDYQISVVRYYGNGEEWSDTNADGPNVEFDGFGLAAWAARLAGRRELDRAVEPLRGLVDSTGMISPDSSIWEVHWNGRQQHFAYTSITAAQGLCVTGDAATARGIRDAIVRNLRMPTGGLAGNYEELQSGRPPRDAAVVEAINWGLIDPRGRLAADTLVEFERLRTRVGRGYFRNDDGGGYDSHEWVFIDLRVAGALRRAGFTAEADELLAWVTAQADANYGLQAELFHSETADYVGSIPMVGFGAGAYMLALLDRAQPEADHPECFPPERSSTTSARGCFAGPTHSSSRPTWLLFLLLTIALRATRTRSPLSPPPPGRGEVAAAGGGRGLRGACGSLLAVLALTASACGPTTASNDGAAGDAALREDAPPTVRGLPVRDCVTRFVFPLGRSNESVSVAGEWNQFVVGRDRMVDGLFSGTYRAGLSLPAGDYGYKFVVGTSDWRLDPTHGLSRYVAGAENSRVIVPDCRVPELRVERAVATREGTVEIDVQYVDGSARSGLDPTSVRVSMNRVALADGSFRVDPATARISIRVAGLDRNKYTIRIAAGDRSSRAAVERFVPMWVEDEPFEWTDGPMYFAFTDRFRNGSPANDAPVATVDPRANYFGGDYAGVLQSLRDGYFDALGIRTIWLSPPNANTNAPGRGVDGRMYSAYHGYWPTEPRVVEEHWGTLDDLRALTAEAHRRGIRVILDLVQNQLHREHPYFRSFGTDGSFNGDGSCVCGGMNCDWDSHALDCWFTSYLPDVSWTHMPMVDRMADDALWWLLETDADGFRVDAVKHMQHIASTTLRSRIHETLEAGNARYYLVGETFTGADGHGLIQSFVSDRELWGQFDFPIFWSVVGAFAQNGGTMTDLDNAVRTGERVYQNATMSPFLGNHDVERFLSRAAGDLRGNTMDQAWNDPPVAPDRDDPYNRAFLAFAFLLTQPGVPLIYYGDEFGMPGAADPDNRRPMRFGAALNARESRLLDRVRIIAHARGTLPGLRRGARRTLHTDGDGYIYVRGAGPDLVLIAINRGTTSRVVHANVPAELGAEGATLRDLLGGSGVTIRSGGVDVPFTAQGASIWVR